MKKLVDKVGSKFLGHLSFVLNEYFNMKKLVFYSCCLVLTLIIIMFINKTKRTEIEEGISDSFFSNYNVVLINKINKLNQRLYDAKVVCIVAPYANKIYIKQPFHSEFITKHAIDKMNDFIKSGGRNDEMSWSLILYSEKNIARVQISRRYIDFFWSDDFSVGCASVERAALKRRAIDVHASELTVTLVEVIK